MSRSQWSQLYANRRWRKLRAAYLGKNPLCAYCLRLGRYTLADVVDHVEPHKGDMVKFWNGQLQGLCHNCHSSVKQREEGGKVVLEIGMDGWPTTGGLEKTPDPSRR